MIDVDLYQGAIIQGEEIILLGSWANGDRVTVALTRKGSAVVQFNGKVLFKQRTIWPILKFDWVSDKRRFRLWLFSLPVVPIARLYVDGLLVRRNLFSGALLLYVALAIVLGLVAVAVKVGFHYLFHR